MEEDSDVIELTEEVGTPEADGFEFAMPEFRLPTAQHEAVSNDGPPMRTEDEGIPTQRIDTEALRARLEARAREKKSSRPVSTNANGEIPPASAILNRRRTAELPSVVAQHTASQLEESSEIELDEMSLLESSVDELVPDVTSPLEEEVPEDPFDRQQLVKTMQMQAFDRAELERDIEAELLGKAQLLGDHRFAPDIILMPPRILIKRWGEGSPLAAPRPPRRPVKVRSEARTAEVPTLRPGNEPPPQAVRPPVDAKTKPAPQASQAPSRPPGRPAAQTPAGGSGEEMDGLIAELLEESKKPAPKPKPRSVKPSRETWFKDVFNEEYLRTLPKNLDKQTERDIQFIKNSLGLEEGARILDLACGFGRHSLEMSRHNYEMAGLDLSMILLQRALQEAQRRSLSIKFIHGDMRSLNFTEIFNGCFLWQTSFGYFEDVTNFKVLQGVWRALKPGGKFLLDLPNRDYVVQEMPARSWWEGRECVFLEEVDFDSSSSVLHTKRSFIYEDGSPPLEQNTFIRLYSLHEILNLLQGAGFRITEISGELHHAGRFLGPNSSRLIILSEKVKKS